MIMATTADGETKSAQQMADDIRIMTGWIYQQLGSMQNLDTNNAVVIADIMEQLAPFIEKGAE